MSCGGRLDSDRPARSRAAAAGTQSSALCRCMISTQAFATRRFSMAPKVLSFGPVKPKVWKAAALPIDRGIVASTVQRAR
jgi:hypothetical protein